MLDLLLFVNARDFSQSPRSDQRLAVPCDRFVRKSLSVSEGVRALEAFWKKRVVRGFEFGGHGIGCCGHEYLAIHLDRGKWSRVAEPNRDSVLGGDDRGLAEFRYVALLVASLESCISVSLALSPSAPQRYGNGYVDRVAVPSRRDFSIVDRQRSDLYDTGDFDRDDGGL